MSQPGDGCPQCCRGMFVVTNTIRSSLATIRYIACNQCGHRPVSNKLVALNTRLTPPKLLRHRGGYC
jgi:hypothetical protein